MFNKKEILTVFGAILVLALSWSFLDGIEKLLYSILFLFFVVSINVLAKKFSGFYLDSEIKIDFWKVKRYGFKPKKQFKKALPLGIILPVISSLVTSGYFTWMASLVFDVKTKTYKAAKRHGLYSFSEMTEEHIGLIAASGIFANLILSIIAYLIGYSEFARLSIYYATFNLLPISELDGNKIFFGNYVLWSFLAAITLIGLGLSFFVV